MSSDTIGKDFKLTELMKFVALPVLSRFLISALCTLDDGLFISGFCGEYSLAAFSLLSPYFSGIGFFSSLVYGVSTLCSMRLGEHKKEEAQSIFTTMVFFCLGLGLLITLLIAIFKSEFLKMLGATEILFPYAESYLSVAIMYIPLILCNEVFSGFFTISGKPSAGASVSVAQTICNFFFDWLFMVKMRMGLAGTAWSNFISNFLIFALATVFFRSDKSEFHFSRPDRNPFSVVRQSFRFGQSSALTCLALCMTGYISNRVLLKIGAEEVLAAYAIVNTLQNMFFATFSALYSVTSPLIGYACGEKNKAKLLRNLKQIVLISLMLLIFDIAVIVLFKKTLIDLYLFASSNLSVRAMATQGLNIVPFVLPLFALNAMAQSVLVASDHTKSATLLSLIENVLMAVAVILIIPGLFGIQGIWFCTPVKEFLTVIFTVLIVLHYRNRLMVTASKH